MMTAAQVTETYSTHNYTHCSLDEIGDDQKDSNNRRNVYSLCLPTFAYFKKLLHAETIPYYRFIKLMIPT